ncbi:MAG: L-serine ammonia-lyase [Pseudomonadota bacterium]|nr:L-serine ammonia-lyase [Pseudomonadota bacterium]
MFLSIFDVFKIGVGPSSSHTMGPMVAAGRFLDQLRDQGLAPAHLRASLHGSLAFTGKGHASDRALILGLAGHLPHSYDHEQAERDLVKISADREIRVDGLPPMAFDPETDLLFDYDQILRGHANGMKLIALDEHGAEICREIYYSIGGGFVVTAAELEAGRDGAGGTAGSDAVPFPFRTAEEMLKMAADSGQSIAAMKRANELACCHSEAELDASIDRIWQVMNSCIDRGLERAGQLPGGLRVNRRAHDIHRQLVAEVGQNDPAPHIVNDWISVYAMAVNEENAAGGQIVTAPTNGAAGVIPATLRYFLDHVPHASAADIPTFLLTAAAVGGLIKTNASISGAEVGCQGEVGSASAMAAAGLCAALGGSAMQVENAAEIALEHHLGMTCDPVGGLVQVPCIERNGLGAIKAVSAASLSLRGDGTHFVSLDSCVETMRQTGIDMSEKYKETSQGGLAVNAVAC